MMKQIIHVIIYFLLNYSIDVLVLASTRAILRTENELIEGNIFDLSKLITKKVSSETSSQQLKKKMNTYQDVKRSTRIVNETFNLTLEFESQIDDSYKLMKDPSSYMDDKYDSKITTLNIYNTTSTQSNYFELNFTSKTTTVTPTQHFSTHIFEKEENKINHTQILDFKFSFDIETTTSFNILKIKPNFDELEKYEISSEKVNKNYENTTFTNQIQTTKVEEISEKTLPIVRNIISSEAPHEEITKTTAEATTTTTTIKSKYYSQSFLNNLTKILSTITTKSTNTTQTSFSIIKNDFQTQKVTIKTLPVTFKKLVTNRTVSSISTKISSLTKIVLNTTSKFETSLRFTSMKSTKSTTSTRFKTTVSEAFTKSLITTTLNLNSDENSVSLRFCPKHLENYCLNKGECILMQQINQYSNELPFNVIANCKCKTTPTHYYGLILVNFYGQRCELIAYSISLAVIAYVVSSLAFLLILIILLKYKYKIIKQKSLKYFTNSTRHKPARKYNNKNKKYFDRIRNKTNAADENDFESTNTFSNYFPLNQYQPNSTPFNDGNFVFSNKNETLNTNASATHTARHLVVYPKPTRFSMVKNQSEAFLKMQKNNFYDGAFYY